MTIGFADTLQRLTLKYEMYVVILLLVVFGSSCRMLSLEELCLCAKECKLCLFLLSMFNILTSFLFFIWYAQMNVLIKR